MGMGRYQWFVFLLCGFGYFLDLCWSQAFGLVASALQQELGVPNNHIGDLSTAFNTGLTVGAFTWGMLVDIVGRRWCFNITCLIASVFGFLFAAPSNYGAICFFASLVRYLRIRLRLPWPMLNPRLDSVLVATFLSTPR